MTSRRPSFISSLQSSPIPVGKPGEGDQDEIIFTTEPTVNFAQLAVRACQRAQGDKNKAMREAWVRLCGTYQSRGGLVASREVRKVSARFFSSCFSSFASTSQYFHCCCWCDRLDFFCGRIVMTLPVTIPYPSHDSSDQGREMPALCDRNPAERQELSDFV